MAGKYIKIQILTDHFSVQTKNMLLVFHPATHRVYYKFMRFPSWCQVHQGYKNPM